MGRKRVFVTVGTTKFQKLIETVSQEEVLNTLYNLGYGSIQFQTGSGKQVVVPVSRLALMYNSYFENFGEQIEKSDLVISHAGAGTCLEVLRKRKPLLVVINEDLMDNHQAELAEQLEKDGYLRYCTCKTLREMLENTHFEELKPYPNSDPNLFSRYLDNCMGFVG